MEKQKLKDLLEEIQNHSCQVPDGMDPFLLSEEMMNYIGDTDDVLRDELILSILMKWINSGILTTDETEKILRIALDSDHLLHGLGYINDTVFCRTFSVEVIASAINRHRKQSYLSEEMIKNAFHTVLQFYNEDIDVRGYVEDKGWAHGAAHGADALDEFARCDKIGYDGLIEILEAIHKKVSMNHYGYIHYEEERMITAVKAVLERKLIPVGEIIDWINRFDSLEKSDNYVKNMVQEVNIGDFLKSFYFRLIETEEYMLITDEIKNIVKKINRFSKY